jgi:hypothetical protein
MYLPVISAVNYEAVWGIMGNNIPHPYDKWLKLCTDWREEYADEMIIPVPIDPDKFTIFLTKDGRSRYEGFAALHRYDR